jgi:dTDP-4-dehydrorhamnose reductase
VHCLVVGSDGLIGRAVSQRLFALGHQVTTTTRRGEQVRPGNIFLDLREIAPSLKGLPAADAAIICGAVTKFSECRQDPEAAWLINARAPIQLAHHLEKLGARSLLLSTSAVFDCLEPRMLADRPRKPRGLYGKFKAEAEEGILAVAGGTVLRLTKVVTSRWGLINEWATRLSRGKPIQAVQDHSFSPIPLDDVLSSIATILESREGGIFQVSGAADMTYFAAAHLIARRLGRGENLVIGTSALEQGIPKDEVTRFTSLDVTRLAQLSGFVPPVPSDVMDRTFSQCSIN